jgi:hypothetical protein
MLCKIWGFHGPGYEETRLLGNKTPLRTSQETHYVFSTESSQLMLYKSWGFRDSDYKVCRLLRYKNPVRTSQETHYISATEISQLILFKIWGFHDGDWRMHPSEVLRHVALVITDVSEERIASIIRMTRIGALRTKLSVTRNRRMLRSNTVCWYILVFLRGLLSLHVTANVVRRNRWWLLGHRSEYSLVTVAVVLLREQGRWSAPWRRILHVCIQ